jgi:hypothetical protein
MRRAVTLNNLEQSTTELAKTLYAALEERQSLSVRFVFRVTPDGSVSAPDFWFFAEAAAEGEKDYPSDRVHGRVTDAAMAHWQLTQTLGLPRWYKMTATVERTGRFNVDFEYRDHYREGDIMREQG